MTIRKVFFWLHLVAGCVGGLVIFSMSLTGVILMYERQMLVQSERAAFRAEPPTADSRRLPVEELLSKIGAQRPLPTNATLTLRSDPAEPAEITAGRGPAFYANPHSGQVLMTPAGAKESGLRAFFRTVTSWHRWLGAEGEGRALARTITGACNLAFLGLILSGAYLWLPKKWSRQYLRPITWFRGGLSGKARDFNWHNVFGIWAVVPLFFVVLTAVPMSYPWATNLLYQLTGTEAPPPPGGGGGGGGPRGGGGEKADAAPLDLAGLNGMWSQAEARVPGWTSIALRLPVAADRTASFALDTGDGGQPQKRSTLTVDRATAQPVKWQTFADNNAGRRLRMYSRFLHTGEALGFVGQTLAGLGSLAGVMLVWTGISLALRRLAAWNARRRKQVASVLEGAAIAE